MPYKKRIADADRSIEKVQARISLLRQGNGTDAREIDRLLVELAKLKALRLRLMSHQRLFVKRQRAPQDWTKISNRDGA